MKKKNPISSTYLTKCRINTKDNIVKYPIFYSMGFLWLKQRILVYKYGMYQRKLFFITIQTTISYKISLYKELN